MSWNKSGNIRGPSGAQGATGASGQSGPAGATGSTGATGASGAAGARGSIWTTGSRVRPSSTSAQIADQYLDVTTGDVYTFMA